MMTYILHNTHKPEDCQKLNEAISTHPWSASLKGIQFLCFCPSGTHGGIFAVDAEDEAAALAMVDPVFRSGTRVYAGGLVGVIGEHPLLPVA